MANEYLDNQIRSGSPGVLCKLDLKNSYYHVHWEFLIYLLKRCGFVEKLRDWIAHYIYSLQFSILISGSPFGFFTGQLLEQRGSLYLYGAVFHSY